MYSTIWKWEGSKYEIKRRERKRKMKEAQEEKKRMKAQKREKEEKESSCDEKPVAGAEFIQG